jgi:uncharacterized damage-inducible protein DinB
MSNDLVTNRPGYFRVYLQLVEETDLTEAFSNNNKQIDQILSRISEEQSTHAYAEGKWTLRELLQHVIDAERIFAYRALCFARKESATLPSFDENSYAAASNANHRSWESLEKEFRAVRQANLMMFEGFEPATLELTGQAGTNTLSVKETGLLMVGHFRHHQKIIEERYLKA